MMIPEPSEQYLKALHARITVLEDFIASKYADWPRPTPTGQTGTMTPAPESHLEGWIVPRDAPVNIRNARFVVPATAVYKLASGEARRVVDSETVEGYVWFKLEDGNYARGDVVTFSKEKPAEPYRITWGGDPAPITPIRAALWPAPVPVYTITNRHDGTHKGIDYAAPFETPVLCGPNGGTVVKVFRCMPCQMHGDGAKSLSKPEYGFGYGNYVIVRYDHDILPKRAQSEATDYGQREAWKKSHAFVIYAHLMGMSVTEGQVLQPYQEIGIVGSTGNSSGPHLHLEVRLSDKPDARWLYIENGLIDPSLIFSF
jgi:murein DD-endopeptidase MepM/ murein hydrolase activator NlpD